jgi:hypothetical protein
MEGALPKEERIHIEADHCGNTRKVHLLPYAEHFTTKVR